jgi:hypothetical protein
MAKAMQYPDASGVPVNMLPRSDITAFEQLKRMVDSEVETVADPDWMGMLASIGIAKGEPFQPDEKQQAILDAAAESAYELFWSVTVYDAANSSGLQNGQPFPSLGSRDKPVMNADGSVDLYFGDTAPAGKEKNWLRTPKGKGYFAILRLYGPLEPALNRTWVPGDFEKVK